MTRPPSTPGRAGPMASAARIVAIAAAGLATVLAIWIGPDLFLVVPWRLRWWMGEALFVAAIAGLIALCYRRSGPGLGPVVDADPSGPSRASDRATALALQAIAASFVLPLFARPEGWGALGDWDLHLQWYEAMRRSILDHGQFPWWNPWNAGGWLLAAEPQFGLASIDTPLVLIFGTSRGLRLALVADVMIAVEGSRRLARLWLDDPWAVAAASSIYAWNGAILIFSVGSRALTMAYPFLPWMLLYAFRIRRGRVEAVKLGLASAAGVLAVIQYQTAYAAILAGLVLVCGFSACRSGAEKARHAALVGLAAGVCLAVAGWRIALSGSVFADYPRKVASSTDYAVRNLVDSLLTRSVPPADVYRHTYQNSPAWFPDLACYVGPLAVGLALLSLRRGLRWWHALTIGGLALAVGAVQLHQPSYWMQTWPVFSSMHVVTRWRLPAMLGLGLAAGSEIQRWRGRKGAIGLVGAALAIGIVADLALYAHQCLPATFSIPPGDVHRPPPRPPGVPVANLRAWEFFGNTQGFECLTRGYGVIQGYCPQLGYDRGRKTARTWPGHPDYRGEAWAGGLPLAPVSWSPNRIEIRALPHQEVRLNQNPGSWWWANGVPAFPSWRCAEPARPFAVRADAAGRLLLEVRPRGLAPALALTLAGLAIASLCAAFAHPVLATRRGAGPEAAELSGSYNQL